MEDADSVTRTIREALKTSTSWRDGQEGVRKSSWHSPGNPNFTTAGHGGVFTVVFISRDRISTHDPDQRTAKKDSVAITNRNEVPNHASERTGRAMQAKVNRP